MNSNIALPTLPTPLSWRIQPVDASFAAGVLTASAPPRSDHFIDPAGTTTILKAPHLLFAPPAGDFTWQAHVEVDFASTYDAGVLFLYVDEANWAKLCFEYSPQHQPMVVSVVTRGMSDDANGFTVDGNAIYLRLARIGEAVAFHASLDGHYWHFVRYFALAKSAGLQYGLLVQSPTGEGCTVRFSAIEYTARTLGDLRNGE